MFPAFLFVDRAFGGQARLEAVQADFFAGVDAEAVFAGIQALERAVDLADQLAVAVARAQFQRVLGLARRTFGFIADVAHFVLEVLDRLLGFLDEVTTPAQQALAEVLHLQRAHVFLFRRRLVALRNDGATRRFICIVRHDFHLSPRCWCGRLRGHGHCNFARRAWAGRDGGRGGRRRLRRRRERGLRVLRRLRGGRGGGFGVVGGAGGALVGGLAGGFLAAGGAGFGGGGLFGAAGAALGLGLAGGG